MPTLRMREHGKKFHSVAFCNRISIDACWAQVCDRVKRGEVLDRLLHTRTRGGDQCTDICIHFAIRHRVALRCRLLPTTATRFRGIVRRCGKRLSVASRKLTSVRNEVFIRAGQSVSVTGIYSLLCVCPGPEPKVTVTLYRKL